MDAEAAAQLGGLALGEVFKEMGLEGSDALGTVSSQLGVSTSSAAFSRDSIYNGKFVDEAPDDDDRAAFDLEAQVDREMYDEKYLGKGAQSVKKSGAGKLMRGEEDDFDDDDEEDEEMEDATGGPAQVKQEPRDEDDLFGSDGDDEEEGQGAQQGAPTGDHMSVEPLAPPPMMKQANVKDLFPDFDYGKTLDFTDLFSTRPRKKQKTKTESVKRTFFESPLLYRKSRAELTAISSRRNSRPSYSRRTPSQQVQPRRPSRPFTTYRP